MKQVMQRLLKRDEAGEQVQLLSTIIMILIFMAFWGVSFWMLLNTFA